MRGVDHKVCRRRMGVRIRSEGKRGASHLHHPPTLRTTCRRSPQKMATPRSPERHRSDALEEYVTASWTSSCIGLMPADPRICSVNIVDWFIHPIGKVRCLLADDPADLAN